MLGEAVIVAEAPQVTISEDTIGYNASADVYKRQSTSFLNFGQIRSQPTVSYVGKFKRKSRKRWSGAKNIWLSLTLSLIHIYAVGALTGLLAGIYYGLELKNGVKGFETMES